MTRRLQPPAHPVTGNPPVDNKLRNAWKDYHRSFLSTLTPIYAYYAVFQGSPDYEGWNPPHQHSHRLPRKLKKRLRQQTLHAAFTYHPTTYYTPRKILL